MAVKNGVQLLEVEVSFSISANRLFNRGPFTLLGAFGVSEVRSMTCVDEED